METPFLEIPVSAGNPYNQWKNNEDEIMMKNPLLNPGQIESLESQFLFENIFEGAGDFFTAKYDTDKIDEPGNNFKNESNPFDKASLYETDFLNAETEIEYEASR